MKVFLIDIFEIKSLYVFENIRCSQLRVISLTQHSLVNSLSRVGAKV